MRPVVGDMRRGVMPHTCPAVSHICSVIRSPDPSRSMSVRFKSIPTVARVDETKEPSENLCLLAGWEVNAQDRQRMQGVGEKGSVGLVVDV